MDEEPKVIYVKSTQTVLNLVFLLLALIVVLIFLYRKLNKDSNGEYTPRRIVYKEGGVRDQVRGTAIFLGTRLGVRLWPHGDSDEDGEEMQDISDEERQREEGSSQSDDNEEGKQEKDSVVVKFAEGDESSDDSSSSEDSDEGEPEAKGETGEEREEKEEKPGDGEGKGEKIGGAGLLINLNQLSGSAIWSEEEGGEGKDRNVTAL